MTITIVREESHGFLFAAANDEAAKRALIDADWVNKCSTIDTSGDGDWECLEDIYGDKWEEAFLSFDREQLSNMGFYLRTAEVWE